MHEQQKSNFKIIVQLTNRMSLAILVGIISLFLLAESKTQAATLLMGEGTGLRGYDGTVGVQFTVKSVPLLVTSIGLWDGPNPSGTEGDGLQVGADVGIWDNSGSLLASVSISAGSMGSFVDGSSASSVFAPLITPVTLSADSTYIIGAFYTSGGNAFTNNPSATALFSTSVNVTAGKFNNNSSSLAFPNLSDPNNLFGSATMRFSEVPIPGAVWLLGTGLVCVIGFRRKFKK